MAEEFRFENVTFFKKCLWKIVKEKNLSDGSSFFKNDVRDIFGIWNGKKKKKNGGKNVGFSNSKKASIS